jgi:argininosuccinate lyase
MSGERGSKLWGKGYQLDKDVERFIVGEDNILDRRLVKYDCLASIAHAEMLGKIGVLGEDEVEKLTSELNRIIALDKEEGFEISEEDCHTAIENHLTRELGDLGEKIHTGRSRNDQVLAALRLYYKDELNRCKRLIGELTGAMGKFAMKYGEIRLPGYTHMRKAMPSSIGLWCSSFVESMGDDLKIVDLAFDLIDQSPLGTGAGYGVPIELDREYTAKLLGFKRVQANPLYVQNSRGKFETTILHALAQIMFDLNKLASDLLLFSMEEFGYFVLPEEVCTGSSIMPQKRNPDLLELMRAKYHELISLEFRVKGMTSNLPSGYNKDLQLTKGPVMEGFDTVEESLSVMVLLFKKLKVDKGRCEGALTAELFATEEVYDLVKKGIPFREAYRRVARKY